MPNISNNNEVNEVLLQRDDIILTLKLNLEVARNRMKQSADQKRCERTLQVGDYPYLKLQPYYQTSLQLQRNVKLSPRFYGPCKVIVRDGPVAYTLELPPGSEIHPTFHVSQAQRV